MRAEMELLNCENRHLANLMSCEVLEKSDALHCKNS